VTSFEPPVEGLAELIVNVGANVRPGQIVEVSSDLGKEGLTRSIAGAAYRRGARFVDVHYYDPHVKRERIRHAPEEAIGFIPRWFGERVHELGEERAASISLSGPVGPHLFDDLDPDRLGRDPFPSVKEYMDVINAKTVNWCVAPCPTQAWAELVFPDLAAEEAYARLWEQIAHICRLDETDPAAAWRERARVLEDAAERLTARRFDAIHLEGPGTDLTVGLLPSSFWVGGGDRTVDGVEHMANLPTEEVFTSPDPARADGVVRTTMPLYTRGTIVEGLTVRFEGGRAVEIEAEHGADVVRALAARDEGAARLGELALVDREGRIGSLGTVFFDTLLDENAASHIALGSAYPMVAEEDRERLNRSEIHLDFMVGGPDVEVTGVTPAGERVPILRRAAWQL
jgi:aminopeptidase